MIENATMDKKLREEQDEATKFAGETSAEENEAKQLQLLEKALEDIPQDAKLPYLRALEKAPDMVAKETDRLKYLKCYNHDAATTAQAIVAYWEARTRIFRDSSLLPLSLAAGGESALNADCQKMLESDIVLQLPNDAGGRPIVFWDQTRLFSQEGGNTDTCVSCCFYSLHRALQDCKTPSEGVVLVLRSGTAPTFSVKLLTDFTVPFRIHACHIVVPRVESARAAHLKDLPDEVIDRMHFHRQDNESTDTPSTLLDAGFQKDCLPLSLGGTLATAVDTVTAKRYGSGPDTALPSADCAYLAEIEEAVAAMGADVKSSYLEAKAKVPELVQKESNPMNYLRRYSFDAAVAARHLVSYWRKRVQVYGKRAMNPMSQTGEGTLGRADFNSLSSGVFLNLPSDTAGNPVVFYDIAKAVDIPRDALLRIVFYMLSVAAEAACQELAKGLIVLLPMDSEAGLTGNKYNFDDILEVIPVRIEAAHVITTQPHSRNVEELSMAAQTVFGTIPPKRLVVHSAFARSEAVRKLGSHGLSQLSLPKSIGGQWGVERLVEWMELRTRFEWNLPPAASHKGVDKVFDFSGLKQPSKLSEDDRIERSRRMNVLHSRRKRERERIEIEVLHEHCDELRAKRQCLVREGERLQQLMGTAHDVVARVERGDAAAATLGSGAIQPLPRQAGYGMPARYGAVSLMESERQRMSAYPPATMQGQSIFSPSGMQVAPTPQPVMSNYQLFTEQDYWNRPPISMQQQQPQAFLPYPNRQVNGLTFQPEMTGLPFASPPSQAPPQPMSLTTTAHPWPLAQPPQQQQQHLYAMPMQMPQQQQYQLVPVPASYGVGPPGSGGMVPGPVMMYPQSGGFGGGGGVDAYPDVATSGGGATMYRLVGGGAPAPSF